MVRALVLCVALALVGCASQPQVKYITVDPPQPSVVQRPALPVMELQPGSDAGVVIQAHRETIKVLQAYAKELEAIIESYRKK